MPNLSKKELQELANNFGYKNLLRRYKILEDYFDIKEGDIVIDGGAYHGDMAQYFSKKVGDTGWVYSFEALPQNYLNLKKFLEDSNLDNVVPVPVALWDRTGMIKFYLSSYSNAGSVRDDFRKVGKSFIEISSYTMDDIVERMGIQKVDFIWTNIEGAEVQFLKGAKKTLEKNDCKLMISCHIIKDDVYTMPEVEEFLTSYGYICKCISTIPNRGCLYAERR